MVESKVVLLHREIGKSKQLRETMLTTVEFAIGASLKDGKPTLAFD